MPTTGAKPDRRKKNEVFYLVDAFEYFLKMECSSSICDQQKYDHIEPEQVCRFL